MLSLGSILISNLVVADLFMYSFPGIILLYLATSFTPKVLCMKSHHFCKVNSELLQATNYY